MSWLLYTLDPPLTIDHSPYIHIYICTHFTNLITFLMDYFIICFRDQAIEFMKRSEFVIKRMLKVLMKRLNVKMDETKESLLMGSKRINLNYYPICPNPELTLGVGRHSDVSTLTFLLQDNIGGLYVRKFETDSWIHVPPVSGSLVINIGDALQIMSNGRCKSIEHRASCGC